MTSKVLDVSGLPSFAFGQRSVLWWATIGVIAIEGTVFALLIASYIFLRWRVPDWPPGYAPPDLLWGTLTTVVILISVVPNALAKKAAENLDVRGARLWTWISVVFVAGFCLTRTFEFTALNCRWDGNAYASIVWMLLGTHTAHVVTDGLDTAVLAAYVSSSRVDSNRLVDVSENSFYYYFVIASWLPIYALIYFAPRLV
jgi:heme/copper-type cytochrome/quinol oxidase subunit 3